MTIFRKPLDKLFQTKTSQQVSSTLFVLTVRSSLLTSPLDKLCQTIFSSQESVSLTGYIIQIFNLLVKDHLYQSRFPLPLQ